MNDNVNIVADRTISCEGYFSIERVIAMTYDSLRPFFDELRSTRIVIRSYQLEDAEKLREAVIESRDHLRLWLPFADAHQTLEETQDFINRSNADILLRKNFNLSMWEATSGEYIGGIGIHPRNWDIPSFEIGYWVRQGMEGQGYITEAVRMLCDFMFGQKTLKLGG